MAPAPSINLSGWLSERVDPGELPTGIRREPLLPATAKRPLAADASALSSLIPLMSSAPYHPDPAAEHVNAGHRGQSCRTMDGSAACYLCLSRAPSSQIKTSEQVELGSSVEPIRA